MTLEVTVESDKTRTSITGAERMEAISARLRMNRDSSLSKDSTSRARIIVFETKR